MAMAEHTTDTGQGPLERILSTGLRVNAETIVFAAILLVAVLTRFVMLETRVMSHDEISHVYYSWNLYRGLGFQHNPLMHGPMQFQLLSLSYFLFGVSDATARVPAAVSGVIAVALLWVFRRWLGKTGGLVAAALLLVSPYMLYYSRYARNEAFVVVEGLLMFWAVFRYFETRQNRWLYLLSASLALHFTTKETSFIYDAQLLLFLGVAFVIQVLRQHWERLAHKVTFLVGIVVAVLGIGVAMFFFFRMLVPTTTAVEADQAVDQVLMGSSTPPMLIGWILAGAGAVLIIAALLAAFGMRLRTDFPALDLLIISGTLTLTQLPALALPADTIARYGDGANPQALLEPASLQRLWIALPLIFLIAVGIGLAWGWRRWAIAAGVFAAIYVPLYTTMFTHALGLTTGAIGSLAYWLGQQGVQRGSQPWYYFLVVQIPIYEFLPAIGALIAGGYGLKGILASRRERASGETSAPAPSLDQEGRPVVWRGDGVADALPGKVPGETSAVAFPAAGFLGYWAVSSLAAYSYAGEKMPWLTVHIALPLILLAGWGIGKFLDSIDWSAFRRGKTWLIIGLTALTLIAFGRALGYLLGPTPIFQGAQLEQLRVTLGLLTSLGFGIGSLAALILTAKGRSEPSPGRLAGAIVLAGLLILTVRASFRASYVNYDNATEFMVYAHSATGSKTVLEQVEDLSRRTTDGLAIDVAYDNETSYPYMWYLRDYTHTHPFGASPGRDLLNYPLVIVGDANWARVEPILADHYFSFEYNRMWWPMQAYWDLTWERIRNAITSPDYRAALWDIWLNRDFTRYGTLTGIDFSLEHWQPSARMRLYVRKDIAAMVWDYGALPAALEPEPFVDPYAEGMTTRSAELVLGGDPTSTLTFLKPRDIALAPDGSLYVADTGNNRIVHLSAQGVVLETWGSFADIQQGEAPGGTFNEPWGVAVAPDGSVYVADTWNHRIQHFAADGRFLGMFGLFGQAETPDAFWGPRDVAVDPQGRIFVADTGNKRIAIFDSRGASEGSFGSGGYGPGQFSEPVGLAVAEDGTVYVADTWNMRIQGFRESEAGVFEQVAEWLIEGWYGQSLENKPYLAVGPGNVVCASDPEGYRILCFTASGEFVQGWGSFGTGMDQFGLTNGLFFDRDGNLWVADSANNRLMRFPLELP
jgi:uncharacterized protein (TIGR03663 family)